MSRSTLLSGLLGVPALAVMALGQVGIRRDPSDTVASGLFLGGVAVAALAFGSLHWEEDAIRVRADPGSLRWSGLGFVLALLGVAATAVGVWALSTDWSARYYPGWFAVVAGFPLLSLGLWRFESQRAARTWSKAEVLLLACITALGFWLRFHDYAAFPDPFTSHAIEEQQTGYAAARMLTMPLRPWEFILDYNLAALFLSFASEPTFLPIRIPFTLMSALTVIAVHCLLRQIVSRPVALAGTFLYAVMSWNLIYSRAAHPIFPTNLFVVAVLAMVVHVARTHRIAAAPWIGLFCGYTLYSYAAYRGTTLFAGLFLGVVALGDAWRWWHGEGEEAGAARRALGRDVAVGAVILLSIGALALPLWKTLHREGSPNYYFEAAGRSLANKQYYTDDTTEFLRQRWQRIRDTSDIFMHRGDGSLTFNAPGEPMLDPLTASLFVPGLIVALLHPRRRFGAFWIFMFFALMAGATLFVQNLDVRRLQGITAFCVLFGAFFLESLWAWLRRLPRAVRLTLVLPLVAAGAGFAVWWNYDVYFHKMMGDPRVREAMKNHYTTLIHYGREGGRGRPLSVLSPIRRFFDRSYYYRSHYSWLIDPFMTGKDLEELSDVLPPRRPTRSEPETIVIQKPYEGEAVAALLKEVYPGTSCEEYLEPDNPYVALTVCQVPGGVAARPITSRLHARYSYGAAAGAAPFLERDEPFVGYANTPGVCYVLRQGDFCNVTWTGTLVVPKEGDYRFILRPMGNTRFEGKVDGQPLTGHTMHLAAGEHAVEVNGRLPREDQTGVRLEWEHDGQREVVPFWSVAGAENADPGQP